MIELVIGIAIGAALRQWYAPIWTGIKHGVGELVKLVTKKK